MGLFNFLKKKIIKQNKRNFNHKAQGKNNQRVSLFTASNGEPLVIEHDAPANRAGKQMTQDELHYFAVNLLVKLYKNAGMKTVRLPLDNSPDRLINLTMISKNDKSYHVMVRATAFPQTAESLYSFYANDLLDLVKETEASKTLPAFAGLSFMNTNGNNNLICGDSYFVVFKGLEACR